MTDNDSIDAQPDDHDDGQTGAEQLDADKLGDSGSDYPDNFPLDRSVAVEDYGITADEEQTGESVRRRAAREVPEASAGDAVRSDENVGAELADSDEPMDGELLGELDDDPGTAAAEEAAVHIVDEP